MYSYLDNKTCSSLRGGGVIKQAYLMHVREFCDFILMGFGLSFCELFLTLLKLTMNTIDKIKQQITENKIILYMKGTPERPMCGFSARVVQTLVACGVSFAHVDVLANPDIRQTLPEFANWPTFPQLYVNGELIGGCDIIVQLHQQGELQKILQTA